MKKTIFSILLLLFIDFLIAQTGIKIGYLDSQKIFSLLPESDQAKKTLEAEGKALQDQMEAMEVEYNNKLNDYMTNEKLPVGDPKKWSDIVKADKEKEMQDLGKKIQDFQASAQESIQIKRNELYKPILEKVDRSIKLFASRNKYTLISDVNSLLYYSNDCDDLTSLLCKELNINFQGNNTNKYLEVIFPKIGICNSQEILTNLPESQHAQKVLEEEGKTLQDQMEVMQVEYNNKVNDYLTNEKLPAGDPKKWSDIVKADKEREIQDFGKKIQDFQASAQESIQNKKNELFKPVLEKVDRILKQVAKENNITVLFDESAILYKTGYLFDITNDCKIKLGLSSVSKSDYSNLKYDFSYGYVNSSELLSQLPEYTKGIADINEFSEQLNKKLKEMQFDYDKQVQEYTTNEKYYSQSEKEIKERKIQKLQENISSNQKLNQETIEQKKKELNDLTSQLIKKRIDEICHANNIGIVFSEEVFLYVSKDLIKINDLYFNETPNLVVNLDTDKPIIRILEPEVKRMFTPITKSNSIIVKAEVTDASGILEVSVNSQKASFIGNNIFQALVVLGYGNNTIVVQAIDTRNNSATEQFQIERKDEIVANNENQNKQPEDKFLSNGKFYALIIGNNNYSDNAIVPLDEPIKDATKLYNVLTTKYNFEPQNVTFIKNATFKQMINAFDKLSNIITPKDNLLVFYAGHGYWNETKKQGYWLPTDAEKNSTALWIPNSRISDYMSMINSKHTLLIADACFSGSIFKTRSAFSDAQPAINKLYELPSKKAMTSGNLKEVPDHSVFMQYLVKRLVENTEKYMSSDILFSSFRQAVLNNSSTEPQYGTIQDAGDEGGEFIFIKR